MHRQINIVHILQPNLHWRLILHASECKSLMDICRISFLVIALMYSYGWLLLGMLAIGNSLESDINCLKSIKNSLEDPFGRLSSWKFSNFTEGFVCNFDGVECWHPDETRILNISIGNMGLKGEFPRGLANCSSLARLDLSENELFGAIPSDLSRILTFTIFLDLSLNKFSGEIPADLANCSYLNYLNLSNNKLTGQIPTELGLLKRIFTFDVSNNNLSGAVPDFGFYIGSESYANNPGLCGGPLEQCTIQDSKKLNKLVFASGFKVGFVLSIILSLIIILLIVPGLSAKRLMSKKKQDATLSSQTPLLPSNGMIMDTKIIELEKHVTRMRFPELKQATDDFKNTNLIGIGKLGTTYKAVLPNGWFLAVKRVHNSLALDQQFLSELMTLGKLRHKNLVPLIGFCYEVNHKLLVYKYMPNGNLYELLISKRANVKLIEWPVRVKIAVGIAKGLSWLHQIGVVHHSITSKCILLDRKFEPKISNFGSAKILNPNPASSSSWRFLVVNDSWKSGSCVKDVHDFGILLIELIFGKEFSAVIDSSESFDGSMVERILHVFSDLVQPCSSISQEFHEEILKFIMVAVQCIQSAPEERPTMFEVYEMLSKSIGRYELTNDSESAEIAIVAS